MRPSVHSLSIPQHHEIAALTATPPSLRFTRTDLEHHLRRLMQVYPHSQLLVFQSVTVIRTHCQTFVREALDCYVTVIRLEDGRLLLDLLGGPTGYESRDIDSSAATDPTEWDHGWSACRGTVGRWHACDLPAECLRETYTLLQQALTNGPCIAFPCPLTPEEQTARAELARPRCIERLRRPRADCHTPHRAIER